LGGGSREVVNAIAKAKLMMEDDCTPFDKWLKFICLKKVIMFERVISSLWTFETLIGH
jgi:hypothetical protein